MAQTKDEKRATQEAYRARVRAGHKPDPHRSARAKAHHARSRKKLRITLRELRAYSREGLICESMKSAIRGAEEDLLRWVEALGGEGLVSEQEWTVLRVACRAEAVASAAFARLPRVGLDADAETVQRMLSANRDVARTLALIGMKRRARPVEIARETHEDGAGEANADVADGARCWCTKTKAPQTRARSPAMANSSISTVSYDVLRDRLDAVGRALDHAADVALDTENVLREAAVALRVTGHTGRAEVLELWARRMKDHHEATRGGAADRGDWLAALERHSAHGVH